MVSVANGFVYVEVVDRFMKKFVLIHNSPPWQIYFILFKNT